ncbi:MAG: Gfo/Idh/MocA family oxidoreductase [Planctomycetota bacterium]
MNNILWVVLALFAFASVLSAAELRIGLIGLDTSHVTAFTSVLNNPADKNHVQGARVVAGFKGGSQDLESSRSRVEGYAKELAEKWGVKICDTIEELCGQVDAVMIESVDGRPHLEQAKPVIAAHKPFFIDKPMAGSLHDALEIFRLAREAGVPVFSASSLRYGKSTQAVRQGSLGKVTRAETFSPCPLEPHHPDLFWYGIHGVESLFTVMGTGCETVKRGTTADGKIEVTGEWAGGRTGTFRETPKWFKLNDDSFASLHNAQVPEAVLSKLNTLKNKEFGTELQLSQELAKLLDKDELERFQKSVLSHAQTPKAYTGKAWGEKGEADVGAYEGYHPLVAVAVKFFQSGVVPVAEEETVEILAFMEASDESKRQGGAPVKIKDIIKKAGGK